jgi:hypothetical protein
MTLKDEQRIVPPKIQHEEDVRCGGVVSTATLSLLVVLADDFRVSTAFFS